MLPDLRTLWWLHFRQSPPSHYVVPVAGIRTVDLDPNYGGPRRLGPHEGIDILSPAGTPVVAAAEGIILDNRPTRIGGNVLWILGAGRQLYYYAHLQQLAPGMRVGRALTAGEPLGTVGNTGNAVDTPPHLHFAIHRVTSDFLPLRYQPIDPYPLFIAAGTTQAPVSQPGTRGPAARIPDRLEVPFDPAEALAIEPRTIAVEAEGAASRLRERLATLDLFLGLEADVDARVLQRFYQLPATLRNRAAELRRSAGSAGAVLLRDAPPEVRERGVRLLRASRALLSLLDAQSRCAYRDLGVFTSAIESLALGLETAPPPERSATLHDYFFDGHLPNVVPQGGGWLVVVGSNLWSDGPPRFALWTSDDRQKLVDLAARRVSDLDVAVMRVSGDLLSAHAGRCLVLGLEPEEQAAGSPGGSGIAFEAGPELPLCVPLTWESQYRVAGFLSYRLPTRHRILETDQILFSNESCAQRIHVRKTLTWPLRPGGRLSHTGEWGLHEANDSSIDCRIEENQIICSGWLDPAACEARGGAEGGRKVSEWHHLFSPTEEYPDPEEQRSAAISPGVGAGGQTRVCVELRRDHASDETEMWFDVFAVNARQQHVFFTAPRTTVGALARAHYEIPPYRLEAELEPGVASGEGQICVRFVSPECSY